MITSHFTNGLGNRLFTLSKILDIAEKQKLEPVFVKEICQPNKHCPVNNLFALFPKIRVVDKNEWEHIQFVKPDKITLIDKSFVIKKRHLVLKLIQLPKALEVPSFFIHFRRGDYDNNCYYTDLSKTSYYEDALNIFKERGISKALVFSNDIEWCRKNTRDLLKDFSVDYDDSNDEVLSLARMAACSHGGISANSTFGYWALQLNNGPSQQKIIPSPFPMKNLWPYSTAVSESLNFKVLPVHKQNNYTFFIGALLAVVLLYIVVSAMRLK